MVRKQCPWRCSNVLALSLLFLTSISLFSMDAPKAAWYDHPDEELANQFVSGSSLLELKQVYEDAPKMIQNCVRHLKNPNLYRSPEYRCLMLYGEPGSGKSTLAKAIPQYAGWNQVFYTPADIQGSERNRGAEKLRHLLDEILRRRIPTVVILDEINQLLENAESKHHDNDATSKEFWTYLDRVHGNDEFFLIGTSNRLSKIPKQVKTRIKADSCEIVGPQTLDQKRKIFLRKMVTPYTRLGESCNENYINHVLQNKNPWGGRDYAKLAHVCKHVYLEDNMELEPTVMTFEKHHLKEAIKRIDKVESDLEYNARELTDEERQDLYQRQNIELQLQIQSHQKVGVSLAGFVSRAPGINASDAEEIGANIETREQKKIFSERRSKEKSS